MLEDSVFQMGMLRRILAMAFVLGAGSSVYAAEGGAWSVSKSSGEVWVTSTEAQPASLTPSEILKAGDTIRTGRNGRALLTRGAETILISPNSIVGLPAEQNDGLSTTIMQQAGSILLEVEKRNVKHFAVETPYLAAVVKGTQFNVRVNAASTSVEVHRGQVEVSDFKSGQIAQVMPGQVASTFEHGKGGLSLSGSGTFNPIEQGKPRASSIERVRVPKSGLSAPRHATKDSLSHEYAHVHLVKTGEEPVRTSGDMHQIRKSMRISAPLGEVRLNFQKVTNGLARNAGAPGNANTNKSVWSNGTAAGESSGSAAAPSIVADVSGSANQSANGNGGGVGNSVVSNGGGIGNNGGSGNGVVSNGGGVGNNGGVGTGGGNGTAGNGGLVGGLAGGVVGGVGKLGSGGNLGNGVVSGLGGLIGGLGIGGSKH